MVGDVIIDRRWRDVGGDNKRRIGRGDSRCLFLGEKRSAQLQVEKLGSGCWRDIGGGGWLGGRLKGGRRGREGRIEVFKEGRLLLLVFLASSLLGGGGGWLKEGRMS